VLAHVLAVTSQKTNTLIIKTNVKYFRICNKSSTK
jgi:hypothetical protein